MSYLQMAAVAAPFGRDLEADFRLISVLIDEARQRGVGLLALPEACLGGYLTDLDAPAGGRASEHGSPPPLHIAGPEIKRLAALAGDMVVTAGYCEQADDDAGRTRLYNSVVCVTGDGVLGNHRKVHQPPGEAGVYAAGEIARARRVQHHLSERKPGAYR